MIFSACRVSYRYQKDFETFTFSLKFSIARKSLTTIFCLLWIMFLISCSSTNSIKTYQENAARSENGEKNFSLPYTRATLAEIQRYADITPSGGAGHKVLCDVDFHGYRLPKVRTILTHCEA